MASRRDTGVPPNCEEFEMVQEKPFTILLLGEIGVGKSTFINAFINYLAYDELEDAKGNVKCFIPTEFTLCDEEFKTRVVSFGQPDPNEVHKPGQSSTVNCRSYVVKHNGKTVRFIDTPGIDSQDGQRRGKSLGHLLDVITYYKEIHAICIFMKPNNAQLDAVFKDCILKLLSHWDKSVTNNILFVFTNTRGTSYRPGQTLEPLRKILDEAKCKPPNIDIRFGKDNIFCLDNEPFRFLVAVSPPNNNQFAPVEIENCKSSWHTSKKECLRLLETASCVLPYIVQDRGWLSNASFIIRLLEPLGHIVKFIAENVSACERAKTNLQKWQRIYDTSAQAAGSSFDHLRELLWTPFVDIISSPRGHPRVVCSHPDCCQKIDVDCCIKIRHDTCRETSFLESSDLCNAEYGSNGFLDCYVITDDKIMQDTNYYKVAKSNYPDYHDVPNLTAPNGSTGTVGPIRFSICARCKHSYALHTRIQTNIRIEHKISGKLKHGLILNDQQAISVQQKTIGELEDRILTLKEENYLLIKCMAKITAHVKKIAAVPFKDIFEDYLVYAINDTEKRLSSKPHGIEVQRKTTDANLYTKAKIYPVVRASQRALPKQSSTSAGANSNEALNYYRRKKLSHQNDHSLSLDELQEDLMMLCNLKIIGSKIKKYIDMQRDRKAAGIQLQEVTCDLTAA